MFGVRVLSLLVAIWCFGLVSEGADLPAHKSDSAGVTSVNAKRPAQRKSGIRVALGTLKKPAANEVAVKSQSPQSVIPEGSGKTELQLAKLVLSSFAAIADGPETESSASVEAELVIENDPATPYDSVVAEISGFIVKSAKTTGRLDVTIGPTAKSFNWDAEEYPSKRYSFRYLVSVPISKGSESLLVPITALAFVTRAPDGGAVMLTLEEVRLVGLRTNVVAAN